MHRPPVWCAVERRIDRDRGAIVSSGLTGAPFLATLLVNRRSTASLVTRQVATVPSSCLSHAANRAAGRSLQALEKNRRRFLPSDSELRRSIASKKALPRIVFRRAQVDSCASGTRISVRILVRRAPGIGIRAHELTSYQLKGVTVELVCCEAQVCAMH